MDRQTDKTRQNVDLLGIAVRAPLTLRERKKERKRFHRFAVHTRLSLEVLDVGRWGI